MATTDSQRKAEEREPASGDLSEVRQVFVVGDAGRAAEQVHGVDAIGGVVRARRVDTEDLRLSVAQPVRRALVEPRVLGRVLWRAAEAVDGAGTQQQDVALAQVDAGGRPIEVVSGDVFAWLDAGDVKAAYPRRRTARGPCDRSSARSGAGRDHSARRRASARGRRT